MCLGTCSICTRGAHIQAERIGVQDAEAQMEGSDRLSGLASLLYAAGGGGRVGVFQLLSRPATARALMAMMADPVRSRAPTVGVSPGARDRNRCFSVIRNQ